MAAQLADIFLLLGGFLIVFFAAYVWKKENLDEEIASGYDGYHASFIKKALNVGILYICPVLLFTLFIIVLLNNFFGISVI
jgi:NSS family neurotransmitter:Na+ symporter